MSARRRNYVATASRGECKEQYTNDEVTPLCLGGAWEWEFFPQTVNRDCQECSPKCWPAGAVLQQWMMNGQTRTTQVHFCSWRQYLNKTYKYVHCPIPRNTNWSQYWQSFCRVKCCLKMPPLNADRSTAKFLMTLSMLMTFFCSVWGYNLKSAQGRPEISFKTKRAGGEIILDAM